MEGEALEITSGAHHATAQLVAVRTWDNNPAPTTIPTAFRLCNLSEDHDGAKHHYTADLHHDLVTVPVCWSSARENNALRKYTLVRPFSVTRERADSQIRIGGVSVLQRPEPQLDLFRTIPPSWNIHEGWLARFARLVDELPATYRSLINAIFWNSDRLYRFCLAPASIANHHAYRQGLLQHTVEVAENTLRLCAGTPDADRNLALLAALLHDAGKADEYELDSHRKSWRLTDRGKLIGHDNTLVEWISAAVAIPNVDLPEEVYVALLNLLTARRGAPDWVGLRQPAMIEADIVSKADSLSGQAELHARHRNPAGGWGRKHPHMRSSPYSLRVKAKSGE
ncbi:HD domain-containing protein [Thioalkalivibrio sp. ALE11]|uniref:HD domain-containing protein n=1 Tax=Thioalkalivibrio sp. ALE11 TaxID=1265494 RepID=UPI0018CBAC28|nr:HD domain-containing protein [Thioalkalivibrio sp. ALE11]